ncbi:NAD(P)H-hydrate dehydratase [Chloroflexota bacterium]
MKILTSRQMRKVEEECAKAGLPPEALMENAGRAVAEEVGRILGTADGKKIVLLVGPGNNGGDGLVAARYLHEWGAKVSLLLLAQRKEDDRNFKLVKKNKIACVEVSDEYPDKLDEILTSADAVIDALFGTGRVRPLHGVYQQVLDGVSRARQARPGLRIVAVDLPSGLSADTGEIDPASLYADHTVALGFPKTGLFLSPGTARVGKIIVADIGIPAALVESITKELISGDWARSVLPPRPVEANKGSFGRVLAVAGSVNYIGAAYLACSGALRTGAGMVMLATASGLPPVLAAKLTEVIYLPLPESQFGVISPRAAGVISQQFNNCNVLLMGCGLGQSSPVVKFIRTMLLKLTPALPPLVLDADALNILAKVPGWWQRLSGDAILTPHPGEMARLTGLSVSEIQSDRVGVTEAMAREWHKTVVLKGAYTVVASPEGRSRVNPVANPGLASAGTGDVLSGVIAGLVAQGLPLFDAAACGVYLHAAAGEMVRDKTGDTGMIASDLLPVLPLVIRQIKGV